MDPSTARKFGKSGASLAQHKYQIGAGPARPEQLRQANAGEILRLLRLHMPCSRADLVRFSGLSAPTVSSTVEYLERKGLVERIGMGAPSGGRPPNLLQLNASFGYVIGVDIGGTGVRVALADLHGKIVAKWIGSFVESPTPARVTDLISGGIRQLLRHQRIPQKKLLTVASGAPGISDVRAGVVLSAPNLCDWHGVPLRQMLEESADVPVSIENDVNLAALGESWSGTARGVRDFVFLAIGTGIGAGIFIDGRLHHGSAWAAGEIGYLTVPGTEETSMAIRRTGPLENIIGGKGVEQAWLKMSDGTRPGDQSRRHLKATEIFGLAESGDAKARELLQRTAQILASAITNMSLILDSSLVVFGGGVGSHPALLEATKRIVDQNEFARPHLAVSLLGADAQLHGAIWLALKTAEQNVLR